MVQTWSKVGLTKRKFSGMLIICITRHVRKLTKRYLAEIAQPDSTTQRNTRVPVMSPMIRYCRRSDNLILDKNRIYSNKSIKGKLVNSCQG